MVVCDRDGEILGELEPFVVGTPWWQDVEPLRERCPWLTVLRLLEVRADAAHLMGGEVTYLAELTGPKPPHVRLSPSSVVLTDDPLRMPWACPGGPVADLEWVDRVAGIVGEPAQHRAWNLSSIWEIAVREGRAWLKCVPPFLQHESAVVRLLGAANPGLVPEVIASDANRTLFRELPGRDGFNATLGEQRVLIDRLVSIQATTLGAEASFLAAGAPDSRWPGLGRRLRDVVARRAPGDAALQRLLQEFDARTSQIDDCGPSAVLVHGDAHGGNARLGSSDPVWFDWGDSTIGHPLLDLAVLVRLDGGESEVLERYWLARWAATMPETDPRRAWKLLRPLASLRVAAVFQNFLDNIEASEQVFHHDDVAPALRRAAAETEV